MVILCRNKFQLHERTCIPWFANPDRQHTVFMLVLFFLLFPFISVFILVLTLSKRKLVYAMFWISISIQVQHISASNMQRSFRIWSTSNGKQNYMINKARLFVFLKHVLIKMNANWNNYLSFILLKTQSSYSKWRPALAGILSTTNLKIKKIFRPQKHSHYWKFWNSLNNQ